MRHSTMAFAGALVVRRWRRRPTVPPALLSAAQPPAQPALRSRGRRPSRVAWHDLELGMFIHMGPQTWQDSESDR